MKLSNEFFKLPFLFDAVRLQDEVAAFNESIWFAHHENFNGNSAIPLISVKGGSNNLFKGEMAESEALQSCPYIKQVIASFGEIIGRSRLMRLAPGCEVPLHSDINYHWHKRVRIHIPVVTDPSVIFYCGDKQVNMKAGECWIFDSWRFHRVVNRSDIFRVHLVIDVSGSSKFWDVIKHQALKYDDVNMDLPQAHFLPFQPGRAVSIKTEKHNFPLVMDPGEVDGLIMELKADIQACRTNSLDRSAQFCEHLDYFKMDWRQLWSEYGSEREAWRLYHRLRDNVVRRCSPLSDVKLATGHAAISVLTHLIAASCLNVDMVEEPVKVSAAPIPPKVFQTTVEQASQLNRNSPCPCGSGNKYKHCHGKLS